MVFTSMLLLRWMLDLYVYTEGVSLCFDMNEVAFNNVYLPHDVLDVEVSPSLMDCIGACYKHSCCRSVGFEPQSQSCHLHIHTSRYVPQGHASYPRGHASSSRGLVFTPSWLHSDISNWSQSLFEVGPGRRTNKRHGTRNETCEMGNTPHVTPVCPSAPPRVSNADVTNGSVVLGSVRTYTCHHGYLDTSSELTSAQTRCLQNSSWSLPSLKCSGPWVREFTPSTKRPKTKWLNRHILRQVTFADTMVFHVKTCNDADLTLDSNVRRYKYNPNVIVGGFNNTMSVIRLCDSRHHLETAILTCSHFRPFWISWKGRLVAVGKGTLVGRAEFMRCFCMKYKRFKKIGISTFINNPGVWLFKKRR